MSPWKGFLRESARRHRRANRFLAAILLAALVLGLSAILYTDSYEKALETQRKMLYGAWHAAGYRVSTETAAALRSHATVETAGQMEIYATVLDEGGALGGLGTVDGALVEMGHLTLLDGAFPAAPGEIAVESGCLTRLGYSYDLGQTLTLTLSYTDDAGEPRSVEQTFRLCGVLQDYAANWKREGATLASFVVDENPVPEAAADCHVFLTLRQAYLDSAADLTQLAGGTGRVVLNDYTYLQYAAVNQPAYDRLLLQLLVAGLSFLAMALLLTLDLQQRRETLVLLRGLGATRGQIAALYLGEKWPVLLRATAFGAALGLGVPALVLEASAAWLGQESALALVPGHILQFSALYALSVLLALLVGLLRLFQIPLRGKARQQAVPRTRRRRKLSAGNIHRVLATLDPAAGWAAFGLTLLTALVVLFTVYRAWDQWQLYRFNEENYPADYTYGFLQSRFPVRHAMDAETLQAVSQSYGVETVLALALADPLPMEHDGGCTADYAQAAGAFMGWEAGAVSGSLVGGSAQALEPYLAAVEPQARASILAGAAVLLYAPDLVQDAGGEYQPVGTVEAGGETLRETAFAPGDSLTLETDRGPVTLTVGAVLHDLSDLPFSRLPIRPYTIFCTEAVYTATLGEIAYGYVEVLGDPGAVSYQTDLALSRIATDLSFSNDRITRQNWRQQLLLQWILALVLGLSCLVLVSILRCGLEASRYRQQAETRALLWRLGADGGRMHRAEAAGALRRTALAALLAALALLGWETWEEAASLRAMANFSSFREELWPRALQNLWHNTHWGFLLLLLAAFLGASALRSALRAASARPVPPERPREA